MDNYLPLILWFLLVPYSILLFVLSYLLLDWVFCCCLVCFCLFFFLHNQFGIDNLYRYSSEVTLEILTHILSLVKVTHNSYLYSPLNTITLECINSITPSRFTCYCWSEFYFFSRTSQNIIFIFIIILYRYIFLFEDLPIYCVGQKVHSVSSIRWL